MTSRRRARPKTPEQAVQGPVLAALALHPAVAWVERLNTGAVAMGEGRARRFVRFGWPGASDIVGQLVDGRFLAVEVKAAKGRVTEDQAAFLEQVNAAGGVAGVARSVDDAMALVSEAVMEPAA